MVLAGVIAAPEGDALDGAEGEEGRAVLAGMFPCGVRSMAAKPGVNGILREANASASCRFMAQIHRSPFTLYLEDQPSSHLGRWATLLPWLFSTA